MISSCVKKIGWRRWQLHACMMTYQKAFTRLKMRGHEDSGPDCGCNFRNRCCIPQRHTLRDWKHLTFWHIHLLCISSTSKQCTHLQREAKELLSNKIWDCMLFVAAAAQPRNWSSSTTIKQARHLLLLLLLFKRTWSPTFHLETPGPTLSMVPETSRPGYKEAPGGGG